MGGSEWSLYNLIMLAAAIFSAIGTVGAVIVALFMPWRQARRERTEKARRAKSRYNAAIDAMVRARQVLIVTESELKAIQKQPDISLNDLWGVHSRLEVMSGFLQLHLRLDEDLENLPSMLFVTLQAIHTSRDAIAKDAHFIENSGSIARGYNLNYCVQKTAGASQSLPDPAYLKPKS